MLTYMLVRVLIETYKMDKEERDWLADPNRHNLKDGCRWR